MRYSISCKWCWYVQEYQSVRTVLLKRIEKPRPLKWNFSTHLYTYRVIIIERMHLYLFDKHNIKICFFQVLLNAYLNGNPASDSYVLKSGCCYFYSTFWFLMMLTWLLRITVSENWNVFATLLCWDQNIVEVPAQYHEIWSPVAWVTRSSATMVSVRYNNRSLSSMRKDLFAWYLLQV